MKRRKRIYYNAQQRAIIWERYQRGDSLHDIARFFDRFHFSIQGIIAKSGGIRPKEKTRSALCLTPQEREEISRGFSSQLSIRQIAKQLNRSPEGLIVMEDENSIEQTRRIEQRGNAQKDLSHVNSY
jgi:hypothetical protein